MLLPSNTDSQINKYTWFARRFPTLFFAITFEPFFYFNQLWLVHQAKVHQARYTLATNVTVAAPDGEYVFERATLFNGDQVSLYLQNAVQPDDWIDVYLLNGIRLRNIQKGAYNDNSDARI